MSLKTYKYVVNVQGQLYYATSNGLCQLFAQDDEGRASHPECPLGSRYLTSKEISLLRTRELEELELENYMVTIEYADETEKLLSRTAKALNIPKVKKFKPPSTVSKVLSPEMKSIPDKYSMKDSSNTNAGCLIAETCSVDRLAYTVEEEELDNIWNPLDSSGTKSEEILLESAEIKQGELKNRRHSFNDEFISSNAQIMVTDYDTISDGCISNDDDDPPLTDLITSCGSGEHLSSTSIPAKTIIHGDSLDDW